MLNFYRTQGGRRFFDHTVPELVKQLIRLNSLLEAVLDRLERQQNGTTGRPDA
jgi:hypothetical protein